MPPASPSTWTGAFRDTIPEMAIRIAQVQEVVGNYYRLTRQELLGECRERRLALPRQIAIALAFEFVPRTSTTAMGRLFGGRDHSTVIHAVERVEEWSRKSGVVARDLEKLRRRLHRLDQMDNSIRLWPSLEAVVAAAALEAEAA